MAKTAKNVVVRTEFVPDKLGTSLVLARRIEIDGAPFPYYTRGDIRVDVAKSGAQIIWVPLHVEGDIQIDTSATQLPKEN